jgi:hypothetical protein
MTKDEVHNAVAVVSGAIPSMSAAAWSDAGSFDRGDYTVTYKKLVFPKVGSKWNAWGYITLIEFTTKQKDLLGWTYNLDMWGQHMVKGVKGTGHDLETAPNRLETYTYYHNLRGLDGSGLNNGKDVDVSSTQDLADSKPHLAGDHFDTMALVLSDLNGAKEPGVLLWQFGTGNIIGATITLEHPIPEPATITLIAFGSLALLRKRP